MKSRFGTGAEESPSPLEEGVVKGTDLHSLIPSPQAPSLRSGKALSRRARGFYDTPPEGQMGESDLQALRTLSEEIARDFAPRLEQTTLVLYDRDPEHFQAQWYVMPETLAEARGLFPKDGADPRQVLRLCRLDREGRTEVVASTSQGSDEPQGTGQYDFTLHGDGGEYLCELGLVSDEGGWLLLARSNRVRLAERNPPVLRTTPAPDDTQAQDGPRATSEQPEAIEEMPVEPALAAVGEPLNPVFPNLELDDALTPRHPAPPEERPGQAQPQDRRSEYPPGVPPYVASYPGRGDVPPPKHPTPQEGVAKGTDLHPLIPSPQPPSPTPLPAGKGLLRHPQRESGFYDTLQEETPGQAGSSDRKPESLPGVHQGLAPYPETVAEIPSDTSAEAALAAVGEPLYPVFPNLELEDSPPPAERLSGAWMEDRRLESLPGLPPYPAPYLETATDLPPGADLVTMPPPLLPSSPGLDTATDDMPGPFYDPRAALSSAALSRPPVSDMELHAELIVQGRAAVGTTVYLFGHPIPVGADGRFYIRHPLNISALQSLAVDGGLLSWLEAAGHG